MNVSNMELLHNIFQGRQTTCNMLWLVSKGLDKSRLILFSEEADYKGLQHQGCNSRERKGYFDIIRICASIRAFRHVV